LGLKQFQEKNSQNSLWDTEINEIVEVRKVEIRDRMLKEIKNKNWDVKN